VRSGVEDVVSPAGVVVHIHSIAIVAYSGFAVFALKPAVQCDLGVGEHEFAVRRTGGLNV